MSLLTHRSRLHGITQLPQNHRCCLAAKSLISQACRASPFKFAQIQPSPNETNHTGVLYGLSQWKPKNLVSNGSSMCPYARSMLRFLLHVPPRILDPQIRFWTHAAMNALYPPLYETRESRTHTTLHTLSRATWKSIHASSLSRVIHTPKNYVSLLLMSSMTSFVDINKSQLSPSHVTAMQASPRQKASTTSSLILLNWTDLT